MGVFRYVQLGLSVASLVTGATLCGFVVFIPIGAPLLGAGAYGAFDAVGHLEDDND